MGRANADSSPASLTAAPEAVRLDVWLDVACLFKTRSQATTACKAGKVEVNGQPGKPHRLLRAGDELRISRTGHKQIVVVLSVAEHHVAKQEARQLYEDRTPAPSPEEVELKRLMRQAGFRPPTKAPDKRTRRHLRRMKEEPEG